MIAFFGFLARLFGGKKQQPTITSAPAGSTVNNPKSRAAEAFGQPAAPSAKVTTGMTGKPITCLKCKKTYAVKDFPSTNGICACTGDAFSFLTDEIPDSELAANQNLSAGAKFVLDADDRHIKNINGKKLILYLKNQGLLK